MIEDDHPWDPQPLQPSTFHHHHHNVPHHFPRSLMRDPTWYRMLWNWEFIMRCSQKIVTITVFDTWMKSVTFVLIVQ